MPKRRRTEVEPELEDDGGVTVVDPGEPTSVDHAEGMADEIPPAVVVTRSDRLWFSDGNVVLRAEGVQFKVYQAILAQRSPVLAAVFGAIQPGNENVVDGCPVVRLEDDSAEDVKHMLLALYGDPEYTNIRQAVPFSVIAAMVRMGKKYEIDYLRDEGLVRLKLEFPGKLDDFDKTPRSFPRTHIKYGSADEQASMELEAINLGHECGIQTILPALYFQVVLTMANVLHGNVEVRTDIVYQLVAGRDKLMLARSKGGSMGIRCRRDDGLCGQEEVFGHFTFLAEKAIQCPH
ncbi:hypothetical protein FA13DRAFT_933338 [Coprinellus micaceus]|uniref:BTB domain-containing protein n=1 Tax=Coprinellus micaceus TaxID=71717 RepID=A0A4Y7SZU0_COPMI|nr:hypothetical protein FA13DRAFT_933338 [Coprinellus micaceus]